MNKMNLAPLPTIRDDEGNMPRSSDMDGFVDESVIHSIMAGPTHHRSHALRDDLALSADDDDFAGWHFNAPSPFRTMAEPPAPAPKMPAPRRAVAPAYLESGIGAPHTGAHRWWVAGLGGIITTLLLSYLLITLAHRPVADDTIQIGSPLVLAPAQLENTDDSPAVAADAGQASQEVTKNITAH